MSKTIPIRNYTELIERLQEERIPFRRVENEDAVAVPIKLGKEDSVLHIRWESTPGVIQFIQMLPFVVPQERIDSVAILIGRFNVSLPILGFTLNPKNGVVAYRTHTFLGKEASVAPGMLGALIAYAARTTTAFLPVLRAAAMNAA